MIRSSRRLAAAPFLALALLAGCGSDGDGGNGTPSTPQTFEGSYTVEEVRVSGTTIPVAGTATLTTATYLIEFVATGPVPPGFPTSDAGTYSATGTETSGQWSQESTTSGVQAQGTYTYDPATNRLTLSTIVQTIPYLLVLQRVP